MAQNVTIAGNSYPDVPAVSIPKTGGGLATFYDASGIDYAGSPTSGGNANKTNAILYGKVDSTSTSTAYTATVAGLEALVDGTCIMLHNGVVTSAAGFTVNINNLGAKKCYNNMTNATQDTTIFNVAYTMMFVYAEDLDEGNGGWWIYRGYDGNTNTIGYQVRTNSGNKTASDTGYRYRIWLTSADGSQWVPINTSTSTNGTSNRTLNTRAIDPFGPIVYRSTNGTCTSGSGLGATGIWQQYTLTIGYSYMASGFSLTFPDSVYLRCTPNANGSATMESIVQALPSTKDGKIYIYLGTAYSATAMELEINHPVYWHDGTGIRAWTGAEYQAALVSGTNIKTVNGTSLLGSGNVAVQPTLVSGTNIKTVNGNSLLGSGDLTIGGGSSSWDDITGKPFSAAPAISASFTMTQAEADDNGHVVTTSWVPTVGETYSAMKDGAAYTLECIARGTGNNAKPFLVVSGYTYATSPWTISWPGYFINVEQYRDKTGYYNNSSYEAETVSSLTVGSSETINSDAIPPATATSLGGVKVGSGLSIASDGTLSASGGSQSWTDVTNVFDPSQNISRSFFNVKSDGHVVMMNFCGCTREDLRNVTISDTSYAPIATAYSVLVIVDEYYEAVLETLAVTFSNGGLSTISPYPETDSYIVGQLIWPIA